MRIRPSHHFLQVLQGDVSVELGAGDPRVAQDRLDMTEVRVIAEQLGSQRVTNDVQAYRLSRTAP